MHPAPTIVTSSNSDLYSIPTGVKRLGNSEEHKPLLLPWFESPAKNASDDDNLHFELRSNSDTLELFFDLFFIANLSTFTAAHSITNNNTLVAYIGLFGILWFTWFQVTLHDVRFAIDSIYERACKIFQFIIFVGFALVGSTFNPGGKEHNNEIFRILCALLFISRLLFAIQYSVVLFFVRQRTKSLTTPLLLTVGTFATCAGSFYAMTPAFSPSSGNGLGIYYVWYVIMVIEALVVIGVSSHWRSLNFKKTHLMERMGLLTLIVIGEGAIGVTKTVSKLMAKSGLTFEGSFLVICIVLILVFIWMIYFDNHPQYHYGSIRQQFWAGLHFPLHLAIVGIVEGSQQIALGRFVFSQFFVVERAVRQACVVLQLDGASLRDAIVSSVTNLKLKDKVESRDQEKIIFQGLYNVTNTTGVCSSANVSSLPDGYTVPTIFSPFMIDVFGGIFQSTGINLPRDSDPSEVANETFSTLYIYYWGSVFVLFVSLGFLLLLTRHEEHRPSFFDKMALYGRAGAALVAVIFGATAASHNFLFSFIKSLGVLPTVGALLFIAICCDRIGRQVGRRKEKRADV